MSTVINLFGGPCAGKSTCASFLFSYFKMNYPDINVELASEYIKDKIYEDNTKVLKCPEYLLGKQSYRISRLTDEVDLVICDSPILQFAAYNQIAEEDEYASGANEYTFDSDVYYWFCLKIHDRFDNLNFFLNRVNSYNTEGRFQTEEESDLVSSKMKSFLKDRFIPFVEADGDKEGYLSIAENIGGII